MFDLGRLITLAPGILAALTIHEFSHGWVAYRLGDPTARDDGRLTLNPIAHLDPIGTIMLALFYFGWAKPVPVNPAYFRDPRQGMVWVALAGPASNIVLALVLGLMLQVAIGMRLVTIGSGLYDIATLAVFINLILAFFNLLPIPPLDGSKVVQGFLPLRYLEAWMHFERYGVFILLGIILLSRYTGIPIFGATILPLAVNFYYLFTGGAPLGL